MRFSSRLALLLAAGALALTGCGQEGGDGFRSLFDGRSLAGWHVQGGALESWQADSGMVSCIAPGGGWLSSDEQFGDFVLELDWRLPPGGNSGVGLRYPAGSEVSQTGMEIQILDDGAEQHDGIKPAQHTGSIYYQVAAEQGAAHPVGEWNHYRITCEGPSVLIELNGREVVRADLDQHPTGEGGLPPLRDRPRAGHIGLQSHESRVDFRNVRVKVLE